MRLIRAAGQNVSPSDDGRLYDQIFSDGLFTDTAFAALGTNNVQVGAMYGDLCGRDFTIEQQTIAVPLPEGDGETTGYIYVEIDTSAETPLSVGASLSPFTPTYEDINVNGAVAQMIVAEYTASAVAVTSVTATYTRAAAGSVKAGSIATVESSPVTANHAIGEYILYGGTVYRVTAAIATGETIVPGTNVIAESVGDALTELNNGLVAEEFELVPADSRFFGRGIYSPATRTVSINLNGATTRDYGQGVTLFTVPEKYRPTTPKTGALMFVNNSNDISGTTLYLSTDGKLTQDATASVRRLIGVIEYVID